MQYIINKNKNKKTEFATFKVGGRDPTNSRKQNGYMQGETNQRNLP